MPKNKIRKTNVARDSTSGINPIKLKLPQSISFSFKYYQSAHNKFSCTERQPIYWLTFLERLKALSGLTAQEVLVNRSSTLRGCLKSLIKHLNSGDPPKSPLRKGDFEFRSPLS